MSNLSNSKMNSVTFHISEITRNITLSVVASLDGKTIELPLEYADISPEEILEVKKRYGKNILPLENVVKQWKEKLIAAKFKGHLASLDLIAVTTESVFAWEDVKIYATKLSSGKIINILKAPVDEGEKINRRKGVRIAMEQPMLVQQEGMFHTVLVRDLSYCGVGFIEHGPSELKVGVPFILCLLEHNDDGVKMIDKFSGEIINQRPLPDGGTFSGCTLSDKHAIYLQRYIATKQLEELSGKRQRPYVISSDDKWKDMLVENLLESLYS